MKRELEIRQTLKNEEAKAAMHEKLLQNKFVFRGSVFQNSYFFDIPSQALALAKIKLRIRNSLDENNNENLLLTLKLKNMQIINGVREAKEYETWLSKHSVAELAEINKVLVSFKAPQLTNNIFGISLGRELINYMSEQGYELTELIKNKRSFYQSPEAEATIDEFYSDEKGLKLSKPQINIEIESDTPEQLQKISSDLGLQSEKNEQNVWWNACKNRSY